MNKIAPELQNFILARKGDGTLCLDDAKRELRALIAVAEIAAAYHRRYLSMPLRRADRRLEKMGRALTNLDKVSGRKP